MPHPSARPVPSSPTAGRPHWHGLDGLRAVAILAVLGEHLRFGWARGGFFGVELFFVLSAFLITSLLLHEADRHGRIDLRGFYARRALRVLPALLAFCGLLLAYSFTPWAHEGLRGSLAATVFSVSNWMLAFGNFDGGGLLGHTWSLGVEEQFYLVWPPLLMLLVARGGRRILPWLCGLAVVGIPMLRMMMWGAGASAERLYFGFDTRLDGLLAGCLLGLWLHGADEARVQRTRRISRQLLPCAIAILVLLTPLVSMSDPVLYASALLCPVTLACLVIVTATVTREQPVSLLELPAMRWIGTRSYGIYLWHPLVFFGVEDFVPVSGPLAVALQLAGAAVMAELSWRIIERPALRFKDRWRPAPATRTTAPSGALAPAHRVLAVPTGAGPIGL